MNQPILHTENLSIGYRSGKNTKVLMSDINLALHPGEFVCLLGQNGVGKSTLLRTILHLQPALAGKVFLSGREMKNIPLSEKSKKVSLVLTDAIQTSGLTVTELVAIGRSPYTAWNGHLSTEDWEKVNRAIDSTRINYIAEKQLHELSDGQMQKALIARAIAQDGDVIIMDEPTAHLDLNNRVEIMTLLKDLTRNTGKAIIVATHELQLTLQLADTLWLTNFNEPLRMGVPEDLALQRHLEKTFYHENFDFDIKTGRATLSRDSEEKINVDGTDENWCYWTQNALIRLGYTIDKSADRTVRQTEDRSWEVVSKNDVVKADSIRELIVVIESR